MSLPERRKMKVKEVLNLLAYGTDWQLVGGKTGKKLCNHYNKKETQEKYMDMTVCEQPIVADFEVQKSISFTKFVKPMISIWVSGM